MSKHREHRAVRNLLSKIGPGLVDQAREAYADGDGDTSVAGELIQCARECGPLTAEGERLRHRIARHCEETEKRRQWQEWRLRQADAWAEQGRLCSALALLRPMDRDFETDRRRLDWQEKLDRLQRYVREFQELLSADERPAAEAVWKKARQIGATHPQVVCMEHALRQYQKQTSPEDDSDEVPSRIGDMASTCAVPITERGMCFALGGLSRSGPVLVVPQPVVVIGTSHADWVQLPMPGALHPLHALILREPDRTQHRMQYRLVPYHGCHVAVGGTIVGDSRTLVDGNVMAFGSGECRWRFHQQVADAGTAVLEATSSTCVHSPDGTQFKAVVLLADRLVIGRDDGAEAHHLTEELPCRTVCFAWQRHGLGVTVDWHTTGDLFVRAQGRDLDLDEEPLALPSELRLYREDIDLLDGETGDDLTVAIWNPNRDWRKAGTCDGP